MSKIPKSLIAQRSVKDQFKYRVFPKRRIKETRRKIFDSDVENDAISRSAIRVRYV